MGVREQTIFNRSAEWCKELDIDGNTFDDLRRRYADKTKASLRRAQIKIALEGNVAMLIFLGKQMLNQENDYQRRHDSSDWAEDEDSNVISQSELTQLLRAATEGTTKP